MDFKLFLREKASTILLLLFGLITIEIFLMAYNVGMFIKIYIPLIIMGLYMISISIVLIANFESGFIVHHAKSKNSPSR